MSSSTDQFTSAHELAQRHRQRVLTEDVITLQDARDEIRAITGKRPDKATLYRWCLRGIKGVKLEHVRLGNRILTSRQALGRFIDARTATHRS